MTIRLLRLRRPSDLLTAQVYEELFDRELGRQFAVSVADSAAFCDTVFGTDPAGMHVDRMRASSFREATRAVDFLCPNFECAPLAPAMLAIRNSCGAAVRLLFISHATGSYAPEWSLLAPLLQAGDVIITPSEDARIIALELNPALAPFLHVVHHPMAPLPPAAVRRRRDAVRPHLVSLGRVHAHKLIHRQIEAVALLRTRGHVLPTMDIGGPLDDAGWAGPHPYTRALQAKVARLGLTGIVRLTGAVRGAAAKSAFLSVADLVCNLSVTIEESFPKTPVEALGLGIPVLGTRWTGLRETVGPCGVLLPVTLSPQLFGGADVSAAQVADGIEALLAASPSAAACRAHAAHFEPTPILAAYQDVLEKALMAFTLHRPTPVPLPDASVSAAPAAGLLSRAAPLTGMAWREWYDAYVPWTYRLRRAWCGTLPSVTSWADEIRRLLATSVQSGLERVASRADDTELAMHHETSVSRAQTSSGHMWPDAPREPEVQALLTSVCAPETCAAGRIAVAAALLPHGIHVMALALDATEQVTPQERRYWRAETALAEGAPIRALAEALAAVRLGTLGEHDWSYVRLVSRAARRAGVPSAAVATLRGWLEAHPDAQESGPLWLELAVCLARAQRFRESSTALTSARLLLGDIPSVTKCATMIATGTRHEVLA